MEAPVLQPRAFIRAFRPATDLRRVLEFQKDTYELNFPGFAMNPRFQRDFTRQLLAAATSPTEGVFVLEETEQVIGFLWVGVVRSMVEERYGYVKNVYVAPEARGKGYGYMLMEWAEDFFRARDITKLYLEASVGNEVAVHLYQRCGFRVARYLMEKQLRD